MLTKKLKILKAKLLVIVLAILPWFVVGQTLSRIEVDGVILSENNDVESVTIFNKSSNQGTITDAEGKFTLKVMLNDVIEISALQFQTASVIIDNDVLKIKVLRIQLVEQVNQLEAITLTSGLTGMLETDISNVKMVNLKPIDLGNMNAMAFTEDKAFDSEVIQDHLTATLDPGARKYLPDLIKIIGLFVKKKPKKSSKSEIEQDEKPKRILDVFTITYLHENFNIPTDQVQTFLAYLENKGIDQSLFKPENEMYLIEFLFQESEYFLAEYVEN